MGTASNNGGDSSKEATIQELSLRVTLSGYTGGVEIDQRPSLQPPASPSFQAAQPGNPGFMLILFFLQASQGLIDRTKADSQSISASDVASEVKGRPLDISSLVPTDVDSSRVIKEITMKDDHMTSAYSRPFVVVTSDIHVNKTLENNNQVQESENCNI